MKIPIKNYAFIDGSFNPKTKVYGCGGFVVDQYGQPHLIQASGNHPVLALMRNVAGEILGAKMAASLAFGLGMKKLSIFYDYEGIENWVTGKWKPRKEETQKYEQFMKIMMKNGLRLYFHHVKGHAGIPENEEADRLARAAVGLRPKE